MVLAVAVSCVLLADRPCRADLRRVDDHVSERIGSGLKIVRLSLDRSNLGFVVGVKDSDNRLKLIGFVATSRGGIERLASIRTGDVNPGQYFDLAAASGMVVSVFPRHDGKFALISWDATQVKPCCGNPRIDRLGTYVGGHASGRMNITYMFTRSGYHRFAVLLSDN
jgi:hypothetical protein